MRGPVLSTVVAAALSLPLGGCLGGTVDRDLFAHSEVETARRVASAAPIGASKSETEAAMAKAGWSCSPSPRFGVSDAEGRVVYGDTITCEAQPGLGGGFFAKRYIAKFLFKEEKVALRNVYLLDAGI